jgi:hypothetical protein
LDSFERGGAGYGGRHVRVFEGKIVEKIPSPVCKVRFFISIDFYREGPTL